ncbi:MAG: hypothetical protein ACLFNW_04045 [Desulfobacterales bacterium]
MTDTDIQFEPWKKWSARDVIDPFDDVPNDFGIGGLYLLGHFENSELAANDGTPIRISPNLIYSTFWEAK